MPARPDSIIGRLAVSSRHRPALVHITARPRVARFLVAAGAQEGPTTARRGNEADAIRAELTELAIYCRHLAAYARNLAIPRLDQRLQAFDRMLSEHLLDDRPRSISGTRGPSA